MNENDFANFADALEEAGHAFMVEVSGQTKRVYFQHLSEYPIELVQHALFCWIRGMNSFPTIFQLIDVLAKATKNARKDMQK